MTGDLRRYLAANMFDGSEDGSTTMLVRELLNEVCENVTLWMIDQAGTSSFMDDYYAEPAAVERYFKALAELDGDQGGKGSHD